MFRRVSHHIDPGDIRKDARELLNALRRDDVAAVRKYQAIDPIAGMLVPRLEEAQYVIAREYGYTSWGKLKEHLRTVTKQLARARQGSLAKGVNTKGETG